MNVGIVVTPAKKVLSGMMKITVVVSVRGQMVGRFPLP